LSAPRPFPFPDAPRPRALLIAALGLGLSCGFLGDDPVAVQDAGGASAGPVAHLEAMRGQVVLQRGGKMSNAKLGYLFLKDGLITSAEASSNVRFQQGQMVEIGPDARVVIDQDKTGIILNVDRGLVLTRVAATAGTASGGPASSLTILTPFGITRLGAEEGAVEIDVGKDGARVNVLVGATTPLRVVGTRGDGRTVTLSGQDVRFFTSDSSVARVTSDGAVRGIRLGRASISATLTTPDGTVSVNGIPVDVGAMVAGK